MNSKHIKVAFYLLIASVFVLIGYLSVKSTTTGGKDLKKMLQTKIATIKESQENTMPSAYFIKANNNFAFKTFADMMKDYSHKQLSYADGTNFVYSPYSYYRTLSLLARTADSDIDLLKKISEVPYEDAGKLHNIQSADIGIFNQENYDPVKEAPNFFLADFPKSANEISRIFQKELLGEILAEPQYHKTTNAVFLNATHFLGLWKEKFDKVLNHKAEFYTLTGKPVKHEYMKCQVGGNVGYEDAKATITYKYLVEKENGPRTSKLYIIVPKTFSKSEKESRQIIAEVGANLGSYLKQNMSGFDQVYLTLPKLKVKTELDLLAMGEQHNYGLTHPYMPNGVFMKAKDNNSRQIDAIKQVVTLALDEEQVEGKAVTEIIEECAATSEENLPKILNVIANRPFFIVITSLTEDVEGEVVSFITLINQPEA